MPQKVLRQSGSNGMVTRREALAAIGVGTTAGLAGCMGDGNDDDGGSGDGGSGDGGSGDGGSGDGDTSTIRLVTSTEGSSTYAVSQGMAAIVNENSNSIEIDARPTDGAAQGMRLLDQGEADIAFTDNHEMFNIGEESGAYEENPLQNADELRTVSHFHDLHLGLAAQPLDEAGIETVYDLEGKSVSPCPIGTSCRPAGYKALSHAVDLASIDDVSIDFADEASALSEGRVDAISDLRINMEQTSATAEEQYSIVEDAWLVHWPEDVREAINEDPAVSGAIIPADVAEGPDYGDREEEFWPTINYHLYSLPRFDANLIYEMLSVLWENRDQFSEYHTNMGYWSDLEFWSADFPVEAHEGSAQFFEEQGADV